MLEKANRFSFFQLVRLLQALHPKAVPVGYQGPPGQECIRFKPRLDLSFAPSDVAEIRRVSPPEGPPRFEVETTFLGLYGTVSPLPSFYTEQLLDVSDSVLIRGLLDLFHHRLLSLFYRVWEKYSFGVPDSEKGHDLIARRFLCLIGFDYEMPAPEGMFLKPRALLSQAGLAAQQPRSAVSLERILQNSFPDLSIEVEQCVARWVEVPREQRNRLSSENCYLGKDCTLGTSVMTRLNTFRIHVGPVASLKYFQLLLPTEALMLRLREVVDLFNVDNLDYEVRVRVKPEAIPGLRLSEPAARLGWSTWIGERPDTPQEVVHFMRGWLHG